MKSAFMRYVFPIVASVAILLANQPTTGPPTTVKTTGPPTTTQPGQVTGTHPETTVTEPTNQATTTTKPKTTTTRKKKRKGALAKTGPGDEAGNFRLILFNGGFLLLMLGAIFFAVKRRVEKREWWRMSSRM